MLDDSPLKSLLLKMLFIILDHMGDYFYDNDLRVLVDVVLRELHDLPDADKIKPIYLRVLPVIFTKTQYPHTLQCYKKRDLTKCLQGIVDQNQRAILSVQEELRHLLQSNIRSAQKALDLLSRYLL